jgi:acyl dehydratase
MSTRTLDKAPNLAVLYPKALLKRGGGSSLPETRLVLRDVVAAPDRLTDYSRVCGFGLGTTLPGTYPHVLAFGVAIALMSEPDFPFPLPGIVHIANTISQLRPIGLDEPMTFAVHAENLRPHRRGRQFDIVTEATIDDEAVWTGRSTYLRRGSGADESAEREPEPIRPEPTATWRVPGSIGRAYAAASGDRNPIHLHPLTARLFGFPRAIAHGMWVKAKALAALEGRLPAAYTIDVRFGKPVLLPTTVEFGARSRADGWDLAVTSRDKPHLTGRVAPIR